MNRHNDTHGQELQELAPTLYQLWLERTNPFSVPAIYFSELPEAIQLRIRSEDGKLNTPNTDQLPAASNPFALPAGYLEALPDQVTRQLSSTSIPAAPKAESFAVPKGYFENLTTRINERIEQEEVQAAAVRTKTAQPKVKRLWPVWTGAAAAAVAAIIISSFFLNNADDGGAEGMMAGPNGQTKSAISDPVLDTMELDAFSGDELAEYLGTSVDNRDEAEWDSFEETATTDDELLSDLDSDDLLEYFEETEGLEDLDEWLTFENYDSTDETNLLDDLSEDEIMAYLSGFDTELDAAFDAL